MRRAWPYSVPIVVYILHATLYRSWLIGVFPIKWTEI